METHDMNEDALAAILRWAGPRPAVADDIKSRLRNAYDVEYQRLLSRRRRVRVVAWSGLAAAALLIGMIFLWPGHDVAPRVTVPAETIARIQPGGEPVHAGAAIQTPPGTTMSLEWNHSTFRLDGETRVRLISSTVALVNAGAVFFSSDTPSAHVEIRTPAGVVRDIGTQFEVRLTGDSVRVRVREGRVELRRGRDVFPASAGTELVAMPTATTARNIRVYGDAWAWIERAAPPFSLEGLTLEQVVSRVAREKGLRVDWRNRASGATRLHGSFSFGPDEALIAACAAARVTCRIDQDRIVLR